MARLFLKRGVFAEDVAALCGLSPRDVRRLIAEVQA